MKKNRTPFVAQRIFNRSVRNQKISMTNRPVFFLIFLAQFFLPDFGSLHAQTTLKGNFVVGFDPKDLEGKWYLCMSSAGKWKKKKNSDATISFLNQEAQITRALKYRRKLKDKSCTRVYLKDESSHFVPKGKAVTRSCARTWYVVAVDTNKKWMVLYYSGTLLHSEEIEVISRSPKMNENEIAQVLKLCGDNYFLHAKTKNMHTLLQNEKL
jgi:hypothetical protein